MFGIIYKVCFAVGSAVMFAGHCVSVGLSVVKNALRYVWVAVYELFADIYDNVATKRGSAIQRFSIARALSDFNLRIKKNASAAASARRSGGFKAGFCAVLYLIGDFFRSLWKGLAPLLSYAAPIAAVLICINVIKDRSAFSYGISVTFKGQNIGVIEGEEVFDKAVSAISYRVENATGEAYYVDVTPEYELVQVAEFERFATAAEIEEKIIENSPELFKEGTGFYINDELIATTAYPDSVKRTLDEILERSKAEYEALFGDSDIKDMEVSFIDNVSFKEGLYPVTAKKTVAEINTLLNSTVADEVVYTVVEGDTIERIAKRYDMTASGLLALNPKYADEKYIRPGDRFVISTVVPFMQTKMTCRVTYEREVKQDTEYKDSDSYYSGTTHTAREGEPGIDAVTAEVTFINAVETDNIIIDTVRIKDPVAKLVYRGTKKGYSLSDVKGSYIRPVEGGYISSGFGYRTHPVTGERYSYHTGLDIAVPMNTPIHAAAGGTIVFMGTSGGYGNLVKIDHGNGYVTLYAHCNSFASDKKVGDKVKTGETIAYVGKTGRATGYHCHFEIRYKDQPVNINGLFPK